MTRRELNLIAILGIVVISATLLESPAEPASTPVAPVGNGETLSYECGRSLASLVSQSDQPGPLFSAGKLTFTSLETQDHQNILLVNAGYGNYVIRLESSGVNRLRFELPVGEATRDKTFFLAYMHGGALRSRFFEYSEDHAPPGHDELEYSLAHARRADNLLAHFDFAIHETAEATLSMVTEGHLARSQMSPHKVENCAHIAGQSPSIARNLRHNLDQIELLVMGPQPSGRSIASTGAAKVFHFENLQH